jgi:hypothetical protein
MPIIPSPFSPFLEEEDGANRSLRQLEHDRKHISETAKAMQERLKLLDKRIGEIKKEPK